MMGFFLEAEQDLKRMLLDVELTEDERVAYQEGIEAMRHLREKLGDTPTPDGRTPREIAAQTQVAGRRGDTTYSYGCSNTVRMTDSFVVSSLGRICVVHSPRGS